MPTKVSVPRLDIVAPARSPVPATTKARGGIGFVQVRAFSEYPLTLRGGRRFLVGRTRRAGGYSRAPLVLRVRSQGALAPLRMSGVRPERSRYPTRLDPAGVWRRSGGSGDNPRGVDTSALAARGASLTLHPSYCFAAETNLWRLVFPTRWSKVARVKTFPCVTRRMSRMSLRRTPNPRPSMQATT